jgi:hypothetical protein
MVGKLLLQTILIVIIGITFNPMIAWSNKVGRISQSSALGENTDIPKVSVHPSNGLTLSFTRTDEFVQQVRVKKGMVDLQFDSQLPSSSDANTNGAKIIYITPKRSTSSSFLMSIVTNNSSNQHRIYQLMLTVTKTEFLMVEIVPDKLM